MTSLVRFFVSALFLVCSVSVTAEIRVPRLISNGMVLQRNAEIKIWGWGDEGEDVTVFFQNKNYHTQVAGGKWMVRIVTAGAGGPFNMQIRGNNTIEITDILLGDVWLCSGQSNMVLPMERVKERYPTEIAASANASIRQFVVPMHHDFSAAGTDLRSGEWKSADPANVLQFSAVAYFFARELFRTQQVPIGLINASIGGTPVESWMSEEALKEFPQYIESARAFQSQRLRDSITFHDKENRDRWYAQLQQKDRGLHDSISWYTAEVKTTSWSDFQLPGFWADQGLENVNGAVWFRKDFEVPASFTGKSVKLFLGRIVDQDSAFVNGKFVGTTGYQYPPRRYEIPPGVLHGGKNTIVVRVINNGGRGGFIPDKPYRLELGESSVDLSGTWKFKLGTSAPPMPGSTTIHYKPVGLFNGMIAPLTNYSIRGAIWYQGESNTARAAEYQTLFSTMITDWRKRWSQGDFPFMFVQLANFMEAAEQPSDSQWASLREAQRRTLSVPNTGMAVAIDLGEWNDIHPLNKKDVGERLALQARKLSYGEKKPVASGPMFQSMKIKGNTIELRFSSSTGKLFAKGGALKGFAVAGADNKFVWADAVIKNNRVIVSHPSISHPLKVRYAWADNPSGASLYNTRGLPASPFEAGN